jgi:hypothetical protein
MSDESSAESAPQTPIADETIGPLTFRANPDYPYPFDVEQPPRFWMEEQSGLLGAAVEVYMREEPLSPAHWQVLRIYLRQYIERAVIEAGVDRRRLLSRLDGLRKIGELTNFVEELAEVGLEPF